MRWQIAGLVLSSWLVALPVQTTPAICPKFTFPEVPSEPGDSPPGDSPMPGLAKENPVTNRFQQAEAAYRNRKFAEAESQWRSILATMPNHDQAWQQLGEALRRQSKLAEAKVAYERAIQLDRRNLKAYEGLALLALPESAQMDLPQGGSLGLLYPALALKTHRTFLQANSDYEPAYKTLEQTLMLTLSWKSADVFTASLIENGTDIDEVIGIAKGLSSDDRQALIELYQPAYKRFPENHDYAKKLVRLLQAQGDYPQAIRMIEQQIQQEPRSVDLRLELGAALLRAKQLDSAQIAFCQAKQLLQTPIELRPVDTRQPLPPPEAGMDSAGMNSAQTKWRDPANAIKGLARVLRAKNRLQQAIALYEAEIQAAPTPQITDSLRHELSKFLAGSQQK